MTEHQRSPWAPPSENTEPKTAVEHLAERYADREDPDDMDDMVVLPGEKMPGYIEVPDWGAQTPETSAETDFIGELDAGTGELIEVAKHRNPAQRTELMKTYLQDVLAKVQAEAIKGSDGTVYTVTEITKRLATMFQGLNQPVEGEDPLKQLPRAEGLRASMDTLLRESATAQPLMDAIQELIRNPRGPEVRSVEAVTEVGGQTLETAGVRNPSDSEPSKDEEFDALPKEVQDEILLHKRLISNKLESEAAHQYAQAGSDTRAMNESARNLSPQAKKYFGINY